MKHNGDNNNSAGASLTPGKALRAQRIASAVSEDYIRDQLGLTRRLFDALENDDYRRLPAPVFVKGYLRRYAQLVGLRPAAVLANYQQFLEASGLVEKPVVDVAGNRPVIAMLGSALALLLATSLVFGAMLTDAGRTDGSAGNSGAAQEALEDSVIRIEDRAVPARQRLEMRFITDSWVEVVDARDHILSVSLQREGTRLSLEGVPPFQITLGYGPGVKLTYLGEPVTLTPDPETFAVEMTLGQ